MPRRRGMRKNYPHYVDLADLVMRNYVHHRHHPYNLRPTTLRRQPGSMNERVLWQNQINPQPPDFDERHILRRFTMSSRSRLYMAALDATTSGSNQPEVQAKAVKNAERINRMATAVILAPQVETKPTKDQNQFTVDETQSTVVLHHNPLFDAEGAKRSGMLTKKPSSKESQKKTIAKKKRASSRVFNGSKQFLIPAASAARRTKIEKAKLELDPSSSFGRNFTRVDSKRKSEARIKSEHEDVEMIGRGENKDQELAPPPPSPMFPNVQPANCPTLAAILESVDNFLRTVKKA